MIKKFKIFSEYSMLNNKQVTLEGRLVLLYGGNGIGKTTLIKELYSNKFKEPILIDEYGKNILSRKEADKKYTIDIENEKADSDRRIFLFNSSQNLRNKSIESGLEAFANWFQATNELSEGEALGTSFLRYLENRNFKDGDVLLVDEIDSGLSINFIDSILVSIKELLENVNMQVIIAINNYHWVYRCEKYLDMSTGKMVDCSNYEQFIQQTKNIINRKLEWENKK